MKKANALILAAGESKRMLSAMPKPLHSVCGKPTVLWMADIAKAAGAQSIMVVSSNAEVDKTVSSWGSEVCAQDLSKGKGTGFAVLSANAWLKTLDDPLFVLVCDQPLTEPDTLRKLAEIVESGAACAIASARIDEPYGYGRIIRKEGVFDRIAEQKDLTHDQEGISEVNVSLYCFDTQKMLKRLDRLTTNNAQKEYMITDLLNILKNDGERVEVVELGKTDSGLGFNDRAQLALVEGAMRRRINNAHMKRGVTMIDPERTYIDEGVSIGADTVIYPGVMLKGNAKIGERVTLLPNSRIDASVIGSGCTIESSIITDSEVGENTTVGPFAYLRQHARVGSGCRVGDFVEMKNSVFGNKSKAAHLAYVGDAEVGERVNIGCGTITVNYDGKKKSRTTIEDDAFIGSNTNLIAPVRVGKCGYVAAGSTITDEVGEGDLAVARARQVNKKGWVAKRKAEGRL